MPSILLMENAGRRVADAVRAELDRAGGGSVVILCGPGNNGGDGFVAARHLVGAGIHVRVILLGHPAKLRGDSLVNYRILRRLLREPVAGKRLRLSADPAGRRLSAGRDSDVVVDAVFGTGFRGELGGAALRSVEWINAAGKPTVAVDVPTGLDADNGRIRTSGVRATVTVTMGHLKAGLLTGLGPSVSGRIVVADLGVPMVRPPGREGTYRITAGDVARVLPSRPFNAHKHSVGKILVLAGSAGFTGAAALASAAAMRTGAGAVILAAPRAVYPVLARKLTEVVVKPVADTPGGGFSEEAFGEIGPELAWADVVIAGPGLGADPRTGLFVEKLLGTRSKRFLLDADVLNHLAGKKALMGILRRNTCILTPHTGEFSRLTGRPAIVIEEERMDAARRFAMEWKVTLVLKGAPTVTATPRGDVFVNSTGNPGMASAGMGDVLAGVIGGLWAGSLDETTAAWGGVFLHGEAGDRVAAKLGERSLMAGDVLNEFPLLLNSYKDTRSF